MNGPLRRKTCEVASSNAMEFKRELEKNYHNRMFSWFVNINQLTFDTIHYRTSYHVSITERRPSYLMQQGFSLPYDSGQGGDGYVPVTSASAMSSISETPVLTTIPYLFQKHIPSCQMQKPQSRQLPDFSQYSVCMV